MIFDQLRLSLDQQDRSPLRKEMAHGLINIFQATFPSVRFGILDKITAINAQASVLNGVRAVHLFGGFAYHPLIGRDSLIFALLHETGHHLANGRRLSWLPDIACECAADVWGVFEGRSILISRKCYFDVDNALHQIGNVLHSEAPGKRTHRQLRNCWAFNWEKRSQISKDQNLAWPIKCNLANIVRSQ